MTVQTKITAARAQGSSKAPKPAPTNGLTVKLTGKGSTARTNAFIKIAPLAVTETQTRGDTIANLRVALGAAPSPELLRIAKGEYIIGRMTVRLPAGELPKGCTDIAVKLEHVRKLVELYAAPPKPNTEARPLRAHQLGRRTPGQQRVFRAAEEAWSQVLAELGLGGAQTQSERSAAKRAPSMAGSGKGVKGSKNTAPDHALLVKPVAPPTADDAVAHIVGQAKALLDYSNKYAALLPTTFGQSVKRFHGAVLQLDADRRLAAKAKDALV